MMQMSRKFEIICDNNYYIMLRIISQFIKQPEKLLEMCYVGNDLIFWVEIGYGQRHQLPAICRLMGQKYPAILFDFSPFSLQTKHFTNSSKFSLASIEVEIQCSEILIMELIIGVVCVSECFEDIFHRVIDEVVAEKSKWMLGPHKEANLRKPNQIISKRQGASKKSYLQVYYNVYQYIYVYMYILAYYKNNM